MNLCGAGLVVVIWMRIVPPSGTLGTVTASEGPPIPMNASRREAVFCTAFFMFLQRWRILGFGLPSEKSLAAAGPMFAVACPRRIGEKLIASLFAVRTSFHRDDYLRRFFVTVRRSANVTTLIRNN